MSSALVKVVGLPSCAQSPSTRIKPEVTPVVALRRAGPPQPVYVAPALGPLLVARISLFGPIGRRKGGAPARCVRLSRDRSGKDQASRFLSTRHFAPARHLASCLGWKPALTDADRCWLSLVVIVALRRSSRRTDYHPVVGEEIALGDMARRLPALDIALMKAK
jgi:hypothetical protein